MTMPVDNDNHDVGDDPVSAASRYDTNIKQTQIFQALPREFAFSQSEKLDCIPSEEPVFDAVPIDHLIAIRQAVKEFHEIFLIISDVAAHH